MSAGYLFSDAAGDAHPVQTRNRLDLFGNQEKRFSCCFRENNMPGLDSLKPGKEHRFDCSFGTQHISILENKIVVAKRDSDHASVAEIPPRGSTCFTKLPERAFPVQCPVAEIACLSPHGRRSRYSDGASSNLRCYQHDLEILTSRRSEARPRSESKYFHYFNSVHRYDPGPL
jgi:hypothetical protein